MRGRLLAVLLSGAALFLTTFPALAIEPKAAADALTAALSGGTKAKVSYDSAEADGDNIVIDGLTVANSDGEESVRFAKTIIESPADSDKGIFESPGISFSDGAINGKSTGSVASAKFTGVTIIDPTTVEGNGPAKGVLFDTAEATDLKVARKDEPGELTIARMHMQAGNFVNNVAQDSSGSVEDITIPPEFFADSNTKPEALGYDKIVVDVTWDGSRDLAAKTMTVRDFTISIQDAGDLSISGMLGKLPAPTTLDDPQAASKASETEIHNLVLRYEDASLTGRILDMLAKQQGISREDYAKQVAAALPFLLAALNNPQFQNEVSSAVGAFLQDPKSITIKLAPERPVSGEEIMGLASTAPQSLPDRLKASVTANTD
jgi:hypothetical protein